MGIYCLRFVWFRVIGKRRVGLVKLQACFLWVFTCLFMVSVEAEKCPLSGGEFSECEESYVETESMDISCCQDVDFSGRKPLCCSHVYFGASVHRIKFDMPLWHDFDPMYKPVWVPGFRLGVSLGQGFDLDGSYVGYDTAWEQGYKGVMPTQQLSYEITMSFQESQGTLRLQYDRPVTDCITVVSSVGILYQYRNYFVQAIVDNPKFKMSPIMSLDYYGMGPSVGADVVSHWWWGGGYLHGALGVITGSGVLELKQLPKLVQQAFVSEGSIASSVLQTYAEVGCGLQGESGIFINGLFVEWRIGVKETRYSDFYPVALLFESELTLQNLERVLQLIAPGAGESAFGHSTVHSGYCSLTLGF